MRVRPHLLALLLVLAALPGCFLDEIDKSMANYTGPSAHKKDEPAPAEAKPAGAKGAAGAGEPAKPSGPSWWATARTLGSDPKNESIAGCQLGGHVEYMLRDDCLARGGQPQ